MSELKTQKNDKNIQQFIEGLENKRRREDSLVLLELFSQVTGADPAMWGDSIVGYGAYHYKQKSGQEVDWFVSGFSPRKQSLSLYILSGFHAYSEQLDALGKHKLGKGCLYINKLQDIDLDVLRELIRLDWHRAKVL